MVSLIYEIFKKWYNWTYLQHRNRLTELENELMVTKGKSRRRARLGVWDWHAHASAKFFIPSGPPGKPTFKIGNQKGPTVKKKKKEEERKRLEINRNFHSITMDIYEKHS